MRFREMQDERWYTLPDGTMVYACASDSGGFALYTESEWEACVSADLELQPDGRITEVGEWTGWTVEDLS